ncbi:MAG: endonuclease IV [Paenibacillus sp. RIFOXYA1_FULL_44_5]|nr:MAG: endonuclease IV [Paenibacillus sp. RIFOXYA1_FULL_44_5]
MTQTIVGCHVSIRGGYLQAAKTALLMGAQAFQYFPKNPRGLSPKAYNQQDAAACRAFCAEAGLVSVAHTGYPVNPGSEPSEKRRLMLQSVRNDLEIAEACGSIGVVVHFGKFHDEPLQGYHRVLQFFNEALTDWQGQAKIFIENQAGEGGRFGMTLEEMVQIRKLTKEPEKIGFCLDTCHAFASGLWNGADWQAVVKNGQSLEFFQHVSVVHLNDSYYPYLSYKDRHAKSGMGYIGLNGLAELVSSPVLSGRPFILETPVGSDGTHQEEIKLIHALSHGE